MKDLGYPRLVYTVRRITADDAVTWAVLRRDALVGNPLAFGSSVPDDLQVLVKLILSRVAAPEESVVFGAFADSLLVGTVGIRRDNGLKERHKSSIWGMYVDPDNRRNGLGRMLLDAVIQQARDFLGVEQVHLDVSDVAKEAHQLYEKHGFQAWGRAPRALYWNV